MHACSKNSVYGRARLQTNWRADDSSPKASENGRVPQGRHKGLHTIRRRLGAPDRDQCNANVSGSGSGPLVQGLIATRSARRIPCSHLRCNTQRQSATVAVVGCASAVSTIATAIQIVDSHIQEKVKRLLTGDA